MDKTENINKIRHLISLKPFQNHVLSFLSTKLTEPEVDSIVFKAFIPYIDVENKQYDYNFINANIHAFIVCKSKFQETFVLEFHKNQITWSNFEKVNQVANLYEQYKELINVEDYSMAKNLIEEIKNYDPIVIRQQEDEQNQRVKERIDSHRWLKEAKQIKKVKLINENFRKIHPDYIELYEKENEFKFFYCRSGSFLSNRHQINLEEIDSYLTEDYSESSKNDLIELKTLVIEKTKLSQTIDEKLDIKNTITKI